MELIADSGSTKTDWKLISKKEVLASFQSEGLNPFFATEDQIREVIKMKVLPHITDHSSLKDVYFYGAGCSSIDKKKIVSNAFQSIFKNARVIIEHDLLGAAVALCGKNEGIAVILGTGSNSCVFDGKRIIEEQNSLGYILGDEGAGSFIGMQLLKDFIYRKMPVHLHELLKREFDLSKESILERVYKKDLPNRYLASFCKWVGSYIEEEEYLQDLILTSFDIFFRQHLLSYSNYRNYSISTVGSVAYYFRDYLHIIAFKYDLKVNKVIKSPIDGLVEYHCDK